MSGNSTRYSALLGRVIVGAGLVAVSVLAATASSALAAPPGVRPGVRPGLVNSPGDLRSVTCTSPSKCWAVGEMGNPVMGQSQVLRFNGVMWSTVDVPQPGGTGTGFSELNSVKCIGANDCWAAGTFGQVGVTGRVKALDQLLHFNGRSWSKVSAPNPDGTANGNLNLLSGLTCSSDSNCWAVGQFGGDNSGATRAVNSALRWNGKKWQKAGPPNPGVTSNDLLGVKCTSVSRCFAVGAAFTAGTPNFDELLQWNGKKWSLR